MTSQLMECCQDIVRMGHCNVQFAKTKHVGVTYIMVKRCQGLILIVVSSHDTILSRKIGIHS